MPSLLIAKPDGELIQEHPLAPRDTVVIGRNADCDLVVRSDRISRHHVLIFEHHGRWLAVDLDSTAGLEFENTRVEVHEFTVDRPWIRMGPVIIWLEDWVPDETRTMPPRPPIPEGVGAGMPIPGRDADGNSFLRSAPNPRPLFIYFRDTGSGDSRLFDFADVDRVTFGRGSDCDLVVNGPGILDLHSILYREGDLWKLLDLQLMDREQEPNRRRRIRMLDGMPVSLGDLRGTVLVPEGVIQDGVANLHLGARLTPENTGFTPQNGQNEQ